MCLEGMLTRAMSNVPVLKYFSGLISFIIFIAALYFAVKTGSAVHIIVAYFCPLLYIIYHFATKGSSKNSKKSSNNNLSDDNSSLNESSGTNNYPV
jgi:ABC-type transport system involved in cytochrome bd biosynthesis fused ATPase/permease subunit